MIYFYIFLAVWAVTGALAAASAIDDRVHASKIQNWSDAQVAVATFLAGPIVQCIVLLALTWAVFCAWFNYLEDAPPGQPKKRFSEYLKYTLKK